MSSTNIPVPNDKPVKEISNATEVPKGVLDFSSEEDEEDRGLKRKASNISADDCNRSPGRMSLLQHGFSKLLERVKGAPEVEGETRPEGEGSSFEEDPEAKKKEDISIGLPSGTKTWGTFSSSDRKHGASGDKRRQDEIGLKQRISEKMTVAEDGNKNSKLDKNQLNKLKTAFPKKHNFEGYSDESEDFELEAKTWSKEDTLNFHDRGKKGRGKLEHSKKRQSASERDKRRSKYTANIEAFSSSEDEHASPQTERARVDQQKHSRSAVTGAREKEAGVANAASFTGLKSQTSLVSKEKNATIDNILG